MDVNRFLVIADINNQCTRSQRDESCQYIDLKIGRGIDWIPHDARFEEVLRCNHIISYLYIRFDQLKKKEKEETDDFRYPIEITLISFIPVHDP